MAGYTPRRWDQTVSDMIAWIQANPDTADGVLSTDLYPGSLERSHLEAAAMVLEEYDVRTSMAIQWAVSESAFTAFGFSLLPAQSSSGGVVFQCVVAPTAPIVVPLGTKVIAADGQQFLTTADGTIAAGALASGVVAASAVTPGVAGNIAAGAITQMAYQIAGVDSVQNPAAFSGGADIESADARMARFQSFISTLQRGTASALEFAALSTGRLVSARAVEPFLLPLPPTGTPYAGLVWLVVDDGTGTGVLDPTVQTAVSNEVFGYTSPTGAQIPGWKAAGIQVQIIPVAPVQIKVRGTIRVTPYGAARWSTIRASLTSAAQTYFSGLQVGDVCAYSNLLVALAGADPDILEVSLAIWRGDLTAPACTDPLSAQDVVPVKPGNPYTGANERCVLQVGSAIDGGVSVTYPEWILATS